MAAPGSSNRDVADHGIASSRGLLEWADGARRRGEDPAAVNTAATVATAHAALATAYLLKEVLDRLDARGGA